MAIAPRSGMGGQPKLISARTHPTAPHLARIGFAWNAISLAQRRFDDDRGVHTHRSKTDQAPDTRRPRRRARHLTCRSTASSTPVLASAPRTHWLTPTSGPPCIGANQGTRLSKDRVTARHGHGADPPEHPTDRSITH